MLLFCSLNATDKNLHGHLLNGTGLATISSTGRVTAIDNGVVTAMATTSNDGSELTVLDLLLFRN